MDDDPIHLSFELLRKRLRSVMVSNYQVDRNQRIPPYISDIETALTTFEATLDKNAADKNAAAVQLLRDMRRPLRTLQNQPGIGFNSIRIAIDALMEAHALPSVSWDVYISPPASASAMGIFSTTNRTAPETIQSIIDSSSPDELVTNLQKHLTGSTIVQLKAYLEQKPNFLSDLMLANEDNCRKILSNWILYLLDDQIATALVKYMDVLVPEYRKMDETDLLNLLTDQLSPRTMRQLLLNDEARSIFEQAKLFPEAIAEFKSTPSPGG